MVTDYALNVGSAAPTTDPAPMVKQNSTRTVCLSDVVCIKPVKFTAVLDTVNKQYKAPEIHYTRALHSGQCHTPPIHRLWVCGASALTVGYYTSLWVHSDPNEGRKGRTLSF